MRVEGGSTTIEYFPGRQENIKAVVENLPGVTPDNAGDTHHNKAGGSAAVNKANLEKATALVNEVAQMANYHLQFKLHEGSGRYQVKVINSATKEVIREIPPEHLLNIAARFKEIVDKALGIFVDTMV